MSSGPERSLTRVVRVIGRVALAVLPSLTWAQSPRGLDRSRNNITYPAGYVTAVEGKAGRIEKIGSGATPIVFVAGWGFSAETFRPFAEMHGTEYTTLLVTLPGFGGTPGWAMPDDSVSHATTPWIKRSADEVVRAMTANCIRDAIVIGHFIIGTHVAMDIAQRYGERVRGLLIVGGELSRFWPSRADTTGRTPSTPAQRAASVDRFLVPQFFRYVTDSTWHANNYLAHTFSVDSTRAAPLWREQAAVPLPIMIRYLSDFYATDFDPKLDSIRTPMLVLQPEFNAKSLAATPYLKTFFLDSWNPARGRPNIELRSVPNAAVNIWMDVPEFFRAELRRFKARVGY